MKRSGVKPFASNVTDSKAGRGALRGVILSLR